MSDESSLPYFRALFEVALQDYENQTSITLAKHPLAEQLQTCDSVENIIALFPQDLSEFRGDDKLTKLLKSVVSILCAISITAKLGRFIGLPFTPVNAIHVGLAILLNAIKDVGASYDALEDIFELIEGFLNRLEIYTRIPPTVAMTEILVKILVEMLSVLALATKQIKQGRTEKFVKKLFGKKDTEAVLQRLDRLTLDEARMVAVQTLEVVHGLVQNMREIMNDGKASIEHVRDALETIQQIASDMNKSKYDKLHKHLRRWLSPPDPWKNHNIACESHHCGTSEWFIRGNVFSEWKASGSLLWIHGKPGAGKSVLCSTIIQNIDAMRKAGLASLAFFYCDFREDQKKCLRGLLLSLLAQLCRQSHSNYDMISEFYTEHDEGSRDPNSDALVECLKDLLKCPGHAPIYLVVDALDECPNTSAIPSPRARVLSLIEELIRSQLSNLRICVTSRPETDIKVVLDPLRVCSVSLHDEGGQKEDINSYIESIITMHPKNRRWKAEDKQLVIEVLTQKADGMFRWVCCQADYICGCLPGRIRHALADLPETLDETYQRTLQEIKKAHWEFAYRLLQCVAVAARPLRVEELAEFLAFDFKAGPTPKFREGWRLEDAVDAVLSTCSGLLAIVNVEGSSVVQFTHFSVKEYLTSTRLAESNDVISRRHHISMTPAHTLVAQACLGILLHLDEDVTRDNLRTFPLAEYAAKYWVDHARFENVLQHVEDGMKRLFDPGKPHLAICVWIHQPTSRRKIQPEMPFPCPGTALHYAALWGFHTIVEFLITKHSGSQDIRSQDFIDRATPLHLASRRDHAEVVRMLLKFGEDVTARNKHGITPLHLTSQMEVAHTLLERSANVAAQSETGWTPLHMVLRKGHADVTRLLLKHGADLNAQNQDGSTPLHLASRRGNVEVTHMLLDRGADVKAQDEDGSTPLHLASSRGHAEIARMILEHGADVSAQNNLNWTALLLAPRSGNVGVTRILLERGADATAEGRDGSTALHLALRWGRAAVACMLLEWGADATARDKDRMTPLHLASLQGHTEVVRMLLKRGADAKALNMDGLTPLDLAIQGRHARVVCILKDDVDAIAQDEQG